jgi:hypothetical protein
MSFISTFLVVLRTGEEFVRVEPPKIGIANSAQNVGWIMRGIPAPKTLQSRSRPFRNT